MALGLNLNLDLGLTGVVSVLLEASASVPPLLESDTPVAVVLVVVVVLLMVVVVVGLAAVAPAGDFTSDDGCYSEQG